MLLRKLALTLPLRLRSLFRRSEVDREMDEELRYHIEQLTVQQIARGMSAGHQASPSLP